MKFWQIVIFTTSLSHYSNFKENADKGSYPFLNLGRACKFSPY